METKEIQADKNDKLQEVHVEMIRSDFHKFRKGEKGCADIKTTVRNWIIYHVKISCW